MSDLKFSTILKNVPVFITGKDGVEKEYVLKELNGAQRAVYDSAFDVKIEMDAKGKAKAVAGQNFKSLSSAQFLALCLYDEKDHLVKEDVINTYPSTMLDKLHKKGLDLSGLGRKALEAAKNELKEAGISGIE